MDASPDFKNLVEFFIASSLIGAAIGAFFSKGLGEGIFTTFLVGTLLLGMFGRRYGLAFVSLVLAVLTAGLLAVVTRIREWKHRRSPTSSASST